MRRNLDGLGLGKWSNCPSEVAIYRVFSGRSSHHYKIQIPPADARSFIDAVEWGGHTVTVPALMQKWPRSGPSDAAWWQAHKEETFWLREVKVGGRWTLWYVAVSPTTGTAYIEQVGH